MLFEDFVKSTDKYTAARFAVAAVWLQKWKVGGNTCFPRMLPCSSVLLSSVGRSQWPRGLRRGFWPLDYWDRGFESHSRHACLCFCFVISCVGRGLCDGLITRPKEFYRVSQ
jgi:hypothetical protein